MCGICGSTRTDAVALRRMNDEMRHRGPDDDGIYVDERSGAGLGATRLSIIDVAGGHQPLANERGTVWAVLNGEIYNHPALRELLRARGHHFATLTDTEVLVHLYEDLGPALAHALEGMFAFAIWDAEERRLVLGRDRFGEKPLFFREQGGRLSFASELRALRRGVTGGWAIDESAADLFFTLGYVPGPGTIIREVRQLDPGHVLVWSQSTRRATTTRYWSPPPVRARSRRPLPELVAETRSLLEDSVRSRMISDVPLGVFLSGGVDSTLVGALAAREVSVLKTFTVGYGADVAGELAPAAAAARAIESDHNELILDSGDVRRMLPDVLSRVGQPIADQAFAPLYALASFARQQVKVAVGGEGADELFLGYPRYRWLARSATLARVLPTPAAGGLTWLLGRPGGDTRRARLQSLVAPQSLVERHLDWVTSARSGLRGAVYGERLARSLSGDSAVSLLETLGGGPPDGDIASWFMHLDQRCWLPDDVLMKADRASMYASLELRTPFLSREIAEFASIEPMASHRHPRGKNLLRHVLQEVLPEAAARRAKAPFLAPVAAWLRGALTPEFKGQLEGGRVYDEGWFDRRSVADLFARHVAGEDHGHVLWPIFTFGLWLDGDGGAGV
jgi:asparagine synthase (glutamine-hydrolysing)